MNNSKEYNIGLDIGVGSVGWAVTDTNGNLIKRQNKNLWGSRIFSEANTAVNRRMLRSARRRIERRKERINMLQSLLQDDMEQLYPNFFPRLRNSSLVYSDKSKDIFNNNYNLFDDEYLTDEGYYTRFPTIYHLRHELVTNPGKQDFRMVYLALHHIIKYRGNFLYEGDFTNNTEEVKKSLEVLIEFLKDTYEIEYIYENLNPILEILKTKGLTKKEKEDELKKLFSFDKEYKSVIDNTAKAIVGSKFKLSQIFDMEKETSLTFASDIADEDSIINELKENVEIYEAMKNIYSWVILQSIVEVAEGEPVNISYAFIKKYEKHKADLKLLKEIYKEYYPTEYDDMFRNNSADNYVSFRGKTLKNQELAKCNQENFYNNIKKKIEKLPDSYSYKEMILRDLQSDNFLRKLNTTDNGAIPHQLHLKELDTIIENQSKYYKTLAENKKEIRSIFTFRIPYYVGPLSSKDNKGSFSWVKRISDEKIRPWNIEDIIDKDSTAEEFIRRMTNNCTYLLNEEVLPKYSLLYSKFCVLNELNNIQILVNGQKSSHLDQKTKKGIMDDVFMKYKTVNKKQVINYLKTQNIPCDDISGLPDKNNFMSNLASHIDMKNIFAETYTTLNEEMYEKLIYYITIFEDKKILKDKIKKEYNLSDEIIKKLVSKRYSGWSRLSKQLLVGIKSNKGESIMEILENRNMNFMQIINDTELGFDKIIEEQLVKYDDRKINYKEDIEPLQTSPANKRAIWQSIQIVEELTRVMKCEPKKIYIEFARSEGEKKKLKDKRAIQLLKKYNNFAERNEEVYEHLKAVQKDKNITEKMYLYFIQNGKCMYSGETLYIDKLNLYEIDHIMPQSYIKDDSIDNKALVIRKSNQDKKANLLLKDSIIDDRISYWKMLLDNDLITQTKFSRLIKREILETDDQKVKFVNRQLVETSQITKLVTNLLKNHYKDTELFAIRAGVVSGVRKRFEFYKNRNVNDYHHAHDAYLLCVVGTIIDKELQYKEQFEYGKYVKKYIQEIRDEKLKNPNGKDKNQYGLLVGLVVKHIDDKKVRKVLDYKDCYISKMLEEGTGEFYNQTLQKKKAGLIPKKAGLPTEVYGGYTSRQKAYMTIYKYIDENNEEQYKIVAIPIKISADIKNKKTTLEDFIKAEFLKDVQYKDFKIVKRKMLLQQQYIDADGFLMSFISESEIKISAPLILDDNLNKFINLINKKEEKLDERDKEYISNNYEIVYDKLVQILDLKYPILKSSVKKLIANKEKYMNLEEKSKKVVINEIINLLSGKTGRLKIIGMSDATGRLNSRTFDTEKLKSMTFVDKSITGIYERRYKIDGVEDNTSK